MPRLENQDLAVEKKHLIQKIADSDDGFGGPKVQGMNQNVAANQDEAR